MEYVGGKSLKEIANERRTPDGKRDAAAGRAGHRVRHRGAGGARPPAQPQPAVLRLQGRQRDPDRGPARAHRHGRGAPDGRRGVGDLRHGRLPGARGRRGRPVGRLRPLHGGAHPRRADLRLPGLHQRLRGQPARPGQHRGLPRSTSRSTGCWSGPPTPTRASGSPPRRRCPTSCSGCCARSSPWRRARRGRRCPPCSAPNCASSTPSWCARWRATPRCSARTGRWSASAAGGTGARGRRPGHAAAGPRAGRDAGPGRPRPGQPRAPAAPAATGRPRALRRPPCGGRPARSSRGSTRPPPYWPCPYRMWTPPTPTRASWPGFRPPRPPSWWPPCQSAPEDSVEKRLRELRAQLELGDPAAALPVLQSLTDDDLDDWRVVWHRGLAALCSGDHETAALSFDAVYDAFPGEPAPKLALGVCAEVLGQLDNAGRVLPAGVDDRPELCERRVRPGPGAAEVRRPGRRRTGPGVGAGVVDPLHGRPGRRDPGPAAGPGAAGARCCPTCTRPPARWRTSSGRAWTPTGASGWPRRCSAARWTGCWPAGPARGRRATGTAPCWAPTSTSADLRFGLEHSYRVLARLAQQGEYEDRTGGTRQPLPPPDVGVKLMPPLPESAPSAPPARPTRRRVPPARSPSTPRTASAAAAAWT